MKVYISVKAELEAIRESHGGLLRPADVVAFAKNPKTHLHKKFTWDNTKAAEEYRLWQARKIIRYVVNVIGPENEVTQVYVSLPEDRENDDGYRTLVSVLSDEELRGRLLAQAKSEMQLFRDKYRQLVELAKVFEAMDVVLEELPEVAVAHQA